MTTDAHSYIRVGKDNQATSYVGPAATQLYHGMVLRSALGLLERGIQPGRGITVTKCLVNATKLTGVTYKGKKSIHQARQDLWDWCERTKRSIPVIKDQ